MPAVASLFKAAAVAVGLASQVSAHMSIWHPSMYGVGENWAYDAGAPTDPLGPGWTHQDDWWFRGPGYRNLPPQDGAVMDLPAGGSITFEITCHVAWTSYGWSTTEPGSQLDACPGDNAGPYHSGDPNSMEIDTNLLSGCALAIADVDDISKVTMDNLAIFSVQHECVKQKETSFDIPARMPACTGEKCICGWFWLANNGTANFYMTAFDCSVSGSPIDATPIAPPQDPAWCEYDSSACVSGSKKPLYAYNTPSNVAYPPDFNNHRPGYHATWSFPNGAQNDIFLPAGYNASALAANTSATTTSSAVYAGPTGVDGAQDLALSASATSSSNAAGQGPYSAIDGLTGGYVADGTGTDTSEWSTYGGGVGSWLNLGWKSAVTFNQIILYDRPNLDDNLVSGEITFSDGGSVTFGALPNDGLTGLYLNLSRSVTTTSLKLTVTGVSSTTYNVGLSEIFLYSVPASGFTSTVAVVGGTPQPTTTSAAVSSVSSTSVPVSSALSSASNTSSIETVSATPAPSSESSSALPTTSSTASSSSVIETSSAVSSPSAVSSSSVALPTSTPESSSSSSTLPVPTTSEAASSTSTTSEAVWSSSALPSSSSTSESAVASSSALPTSSATSDAPASSSTVVSVSPSSSSSSSPSPSPVQTTSSSASPVPTTQAATTSSTSTINWFIAPVTTQAASSSAPVVSSAPVQSSSSTSSASPLPSSSSSSSSASPSPSTTSVRALTTTQAPTTTQKPTTTSSQKASTSSASPSPSSTGPVDLALRATATASSQWTQSPASAAIDGVVGGYVTDKQGDETKEWQSYTEGVGAWIRLDWPTAVSFNQVQLWDRPNTQDQILAGNITFADNTGVSFGELPNNGKSALVLNLAKTVSTTSLRVYVSKVSSSTQNVGLSEIQVYAADLSRVAASQKLSPTAAPVPKTTQAPSKASTTTVAPKTTTTTKAGVIQWFLAPILSTSTAKPAVPTTTTHRVLAAPTTTSSTSSAVHWYIAPTGVVANPKAAGRREKRHARDFLLA
ncbi:hypothetical protein JCM8097_004736 [Rhodosporidiobolus ruineniae]